VREVGTAPKLRALLHRHLYDLALGEISRRPELYSPSFVASIHQKHAEYLLGREEFAAATDAFIATIAFGTVEPSLVVRRLLDAQRDWELSLYLEALHEAGQATANHTTLLLHCYAKLRASEKLISFIDGPVRVGEAIKAAKAVGKSGDSVPEAATLKLDVDTAISVCRAASLALSSGNTVEPGSHAALLLRQALRLATAFDLHDAALGLLLDDLHDARAALEYIRGLPRAAAEEAVRSRGRELVVSDPGEATDVLLRLCTREEPGHPRLEATEFVHHFAGRDAALRSFFERLVTELPAQKVPQSVWHTLLELVLRRREVCLQYAAAAEKERSVGGASGTEAVPDSTVDSTVALLDGLSCDEPLPADGELQELEQRAMSLLRDTRLDLDSSHCLVLCKAHGFDAALPLLLERLGLYVEVARHHMASGNVDLFFEGMESHGTHGQSGTHASGVTRQVLAYLSGRSADLYSPPPAADASDKEVAEFEKLRKQASEAAQLLQRLLADISADQSMPLAHVVETLAAPVNPVVSAADDPHRLRPCPLGVCREFLLTSISQLHANATDAASNAAALEESAAEKRSAIARLKHQPIKFSATKCAHCRTNLDLPAVHYFCGHSFHLRCVDMVALSSGPAGMPVEIPGIGDVNADDGVSVCPLCAPQAAHLRAVRRGMEAQARDAEGFFKSLEAGPDGFSAVTDYLALAPLTATSAFTH
jgi:hypothetical protein